MRKVCPRTLTVCIFDEVPELRWSSGSTRESAQTADKRRSTRSSAFDGACKVAKPTADVGDLIQNKLNHGV